MLKLIILDIDGVLTDGTKIYDNTGKCVSKRFCDKDFTAIKRFKAIGIKVICLSGDNNINEVICKKRNIPFYFTRQENGLMRNKADYIEDFKKIYNITEMEMLYIGDDIFDLDISKKVFYRFCPSDAVQELKNLCTTLKVKGGENCINCLYEYLLNNDIIKDADINTVLELDKNEAAH